jgi:hypothetical protein
MSDGYAIAPVDMTVRTDMEVGAARTRRRTSTRNDKLTLSWWMTDAQLTIFRTWFENPAEAAGGASWFTVNLAIGTTGIVSTTARFTGPPKISHAGGLQWSVTGEVEVR